MSHHPLVEVLVDVMKMAGRPSVPLLPTGTFKQHGHGCVTDISISCDVYCISTKFFECVCETKRTQLRGCSEYCCTLDYQGDYCSYCMLCFTDTRQ